MTRPVINTKIGTGLKRFFNFKTGNISGTSYQSGQKLINL